jgi:hypothetical protein
MRRIKQDSAQKRAKETAHRTPPIAAIVGPGCYAGLIELNFLQIGQQRRFHNSNRQRPACVETDIVRDAMLKDGAAANTLAAAVRSLRSARRMIRAIARGDRVCQPMTTTRNSFAIVARSGMTCVANERAGKHRHGEY